MAKGKTIADYQKENKSLDAQYELLTKIGNTDAAREMHIKKYLNNLEIIKKISEDTVLTEAEKLKQIEAINNEQKEINAELEKEIKHRKKIEFHVTNINNQLKKGWEYLMQSDKAIRQTILGLGMSGTKAEAMRTSFEGSARAVGQMGGTLTDIQSIMSGYADETGRARVLSAEMVTDIASIGKGTGIGIEQATRLGAQFEIMGFDARKTVDYVQGIVDTSERMGVNTTKVLKNVNDNFKKLNTYNFQQGSKGMAQMAMYAEKMKVNMSDALNAATIAKGLEGAIDLAAQLQVMGGEFAKTDPFEMLFLSRNDPAKFTEKISDMTKGVVSFRKLADGTFEKFISPADRQRLEAAGKALGISAEEMTQIAQRRAEMDKMNQDLAGTGLTGREKELVQGAAIFNAKSGKFQVQLAGQMKDISTLTSEQAGSFVKEQALLKDRAIASQTFEDAFKATLEELRASLLPLLRGINQVLAFIRPIVSTFAKGIEKIFNNNFGKWMGMFFAGAVLLNGAVARITGRGIADRMAGRGGMAGGAGRLFGGKVPAGTPPVTATPLPASGPGSSGLGQKRIMEGQGAKMAGMGKAGMGIGAGIGAAALGIGAGIGAAAAGISLLANAMSKLDPKQAEVLLKIVKTLGWFIGGGALIAGAIMVFSSAALAAAPGLYTFGGAVALIGAGIGVAAAGIGVMGWGLGKMLDASKGAGKELGAVALGIAEIGLAMASTGVASIFGGGAMVVGLKQISKQAPAIAQVGEAFKNINAVLSGSKEDFIAVQNAITAIAGTSVKGGSVFADLANLMKTPLKVEFIDGNVQLASDITLNIDGQRFMQKIFRVNSQIQASEAARQGLATA